MNTCTYSNDNMGSYLAHNMINEKLEKPKTKLSCRGTNYLEKPFQRSHLD
jgi:hypothetical protein